MSERTVNAWAANEAKNPLKPFTYNLPALEDEDVDIRVEYCGICHSDLSMLNNEFGMTTFPFVPGHEIVGVVEHAGKGVKGIKEGDRVGLGWFSDSCMHCDQCMSGSHNLCYTAGQTIIGRHGGFADTVRCHWSWAIPIPEGVETRSAGPLLCGGITVFNPILMAGVLPTHRVGVIGIGGLGHLALQFLNKWGCEVTAFTSSASKAQQAKELGAHHVVNSRDDAAMAELQGNFKFILNTTNVNLNWQSYFDALSPKGIFHNVGIVPDPIPVSAFTLIMGEKTVSGSPLGSPAQTRTMLEFCARHNIKPVTEEFKIDEVNDALKHLEEGKARFRLVLKV